MRKSNNNKSSWDWFAGTKRVKPPSQVVRRSWGRKSMSKKSVKKYQD